MKKGVKLAILGVATGGIAVGGYFGWKKIQEKKKKKEDEDDNVIENIVEELEEEVKNNLIKDARDETLNYILDEEIYKEDPEKFKTLMEGVKSANNMEAENEKVKNEKKANKKQFIYRAIIDGAWMVLTTGLCWFGFAFEQTGNFTSKTLNRIHQRFPNRFGSLD